VLERTPCPTNVRFLEKTPKNALRIPFLNAIFPDALFVILLRHPLSTISSLMEAWSVPGKWFTTVSELPGWDRQEWKFLLPPGWRELNGQPLARVAACQWEKANSYILDDLRNLPSSRWHAIEFDTLISDPAATLRRLCDFAGVELDPVLAKLAAEGLPHSQKTISAPSR